MPFAARFVAGVPETVMLVPLFTTFMPGNENGPEPSVSVTGPVPPETVIGWLYGKPAVVCGKLKEPVPLFGLRVTAGLTVNEEFDTVTAPSESVAVTVNVIVPADVGVPVIAIVAPLVGTTRPGIAFAMLLT